MTVGTKFQSPLMPSNISPMTRNFPMNIFSSTQQHNQLTADTKGLLNGPGQNNCFLNCAVQICDSIELFCKQHKHRH
ncbi:CLUMA_CG005891, isoform A [Clunio marinus]|uniref:CLUMA_CG005891, isoform A n=1 Tax=Clunio marinus TaxID=568069 RepID=A0A1J1HYC4_9DIPT|nr:CLUMA_CG005891, isoform A [Clunio marinus]